jgi:hypothetical protein
MLLIVPFGLAVSAPADDAPPFYSLGAGLTTGYTGFTDQVTLLALRTSRVRVVVDPNRCTLDAFGRPQACTKIASTVVPTRLTVLDRELGQGVTTTLVGLDLLPAYRLVITTTAAGSSARLLILEHEQVTQVLPLQVLF